jgi:hypothetical protein
LDYPPKQGERTPEENGRKQCRETEEKRDQTGQEASEGQQQWQEDSKGRAILDGLMITFSPSFLFRSMLLNNVFMMYNMYYFEFFVLFCEFFMLALVHRL